MLKTDKISTAVERYRSWYRGAHKKSLSHFANACAVLPGGNTRSVLHFEPFPFAVAKGDGCHIVDIDGNRYLDALGNYSAGLYGHSNSDIADAIGEAVRSGLNLSGINPREVDLALAIVSRFPSIERVRFTNSGTEANLMAIVTAKAFTSRQVIVVFEGGYHGSVLTFAQASDPVNVPYEFVVLPYNDPTSVTETFECRGSEIAAVLVEPMQSAAGCIPADTDFLKLLRDICSRTGSLLIFDEVVTSRMSDGGMQKLLGILPDITTLGKYLGGGVSSGAFGGRESIMRLYDSRRNGALMHAGTFNNNSLTLAAGFIGLTKHFTADAADKLYQDGEELLTALNSECRRRNAPLQFTGRGAVFAAHFVKKTIKSIRDLANENQRLKELYFLYMLHGGIYLARRGMITLSLDMKSDDRSQILRMTVSFLNEFMELLDYD